MVAKPTQPVQAAKPSGGGMQTPPPPELSPSASSPAPVAGRVDAAERDASESGTPSAPAPVAEQPAPSAAASSKPKPFRPVAAASAAQQQQQPTPAPKWSVGQRQPSPAPAASAAGQSVSPPPPDAASVPLASGANTEASQPPEAHPKLGATRGTAAAGIRAPSVVKSTSEPASAPAGHLGAAALSAAGAGAKSRGPSAPRASTGAAANTAAPLKRASRGENAAAAADGASSLEPGLPSSLRDALRLDREQHEAHDDQVSTASKPAPPQSRATAPDAVQQSSVPPIADALAMSHEPDATGDVQGSVAVLQTSISAPAVEPLPGAILGLPLWVSDAGDGYLPGVVVEAAASSPGSAVVRLTRPLPPQGVASSGAHSGPTSVVVAIDVLRVVLDYGGAVAPGRLRIWRRHASAPGDIDGEDVSDLELLRVQNE